jgi:hypothetical protein
VDDDDCDEEGEDEDAVQEGGAGEATTNDPAPRQGGATKSVKMASGHGGWGVDARGCERPAPAAGSMPGMLPWLQWSQPVADSARIACPAPPCLTAEGGDKHTASKFARMGTGPLTGTKADRQAGRTKRTKSWWT